MKLSLLSYSYKSTPIEWRERLALSPDQVPGWLLDVRERAKLQELVVLSTCNRVEYYFVTDDEGYAFRSLVDMLRDRFPEGGVDLDGCAVKLSRQAALNHVFRVAASLESMVIGEPQILGQVKDAHQLATTHRLTGPFLGALMPQVFRTAKRVRTETQIARFPVSISFVAAELAGKIFDNLGDQTVLVVGAGEMAELAVTHLMAAGVRRLVITNRTFASAVSLAERFGGSAVPFDRMGEHLTHADIVISSTGARGFIVNADMVRPAMKSRRGKPMFFIDIAVPRDIDPAINQLSDVYLYDIDDLQSVANSNLKEREREAAAAQAIIDEDLGRFLHWIESLAMVPTVRALRERFTAVGEQELERALAKMRHLPSQDQQQVEKAVRAVVNKLLHVPSTRLKTLAEDQDGLLYAEALCAVFDLRPDAAAAPSGTARDESAATPSGAARDDTEASPARETGGTVLRLPVHHKSAP
jgi:glutamyl-tRNA reductase